MIKIAIIGTGAISDTHIQAFQQFPERCRITALVNNEQDKAERKAARYGLDVPIYTDWKDLLADHTPDLAAILLPPFLHAEASIDMLNAGVHVFLEKPMAPTVEECDAILQAAEANDRLLSVVAQNRFKTPTMRLKQVLEAGIAGDIVHAQVDSFWWRGSSYYDLWWRGTWEKEGGGCTMNHAVHHIDLFHWMMGMPDSLLSLVTNLNHMNSEVEDFSTTVFRYDDGRIGQLTASLVHHGEEQRLVFQGERASVSAPWKVAASKPRPNGFPDPDPALEAEIDRFYHRLPEVRYDGHTGQVDNVLGALLGEQELLIDGQAGRRTIELVAAIYQSGVQEKPVRLPLSPDSPFYSRAGILANAPRFHEKKHSVRGFDDEAITLGSEYRENG